MLKYHLLLFIRNFQRTKLFSFINILGLSIGISCALLIYTYVDHELSFDQFHQDIDRIYRVNQTFIWGEDNDHQFASTGPAVAYALSEELSEVEEVTRIHTPGNYLVSYKNKDNQMASFDEKNILAADSNFFNVFTFPEVSGNKKAMLEKPYSVVMTESTARKYFMNEPAIGKLVTLGIEENKQTYLVTGVIKDIPANSYIDFDMMLSMTSFPDVKKRSWSWIWTGFVTFAKLDAHASIETVEQKLASIPRKYAEPTLKRIMGQSFDEYIASGKEWNLYFQPMGSIRLYSNNIYNRLNDVGNIKNIYALSGTAIFIILLSCVNFMNLTTSQYTKRAKSVGIRKILGSSRIRLSGQFISEAFLFCMIAAILGILMATYALTSFNELIDKELMLNPLNNPSIFIIMLVLLVSMSLLSGSYPAVFLSAFNPIDTLKGNLNTGREGGKIRNGLVVFQFTASIVLMICTVVVFQQLNFFNQKDIGFDRENLLIIDRAEWIDGKESFIHEVQQIESVQTASIATSVPPRIWDGDLFKANGSTEDGVPINYVKTDEHYVDVLGLELIKGRNFQKEMSDDRNGVILNETAIKSLGWSINDPLDKMNLLYAGDNKKFKVIGVVKDFNYWSLQTPIEPLGLFHYDGDIFGNSRNFVTLRIKPQSVEEWDTTLSALEDQWRKYVNEAPFQYEFVDQAFAASFDNIKRFGSLLTVFAILAITIAGMGLLGMIVYTLEQRTKEIGIRKVVGASVFNIILLLSRSYFKLIIIAVVIGIPISIQMLLMWLEDFEYRVSLDPTVFVVVGLGTIIISILITIYHSMKAATMNPVDVLKDE